MLETESGSGRKSRPGPVNPLTNELVTSTLGQVPHGS